MPNILKNHPFAVEAFFERSLVLTFAAPKEALQDLIPSCLELDAYQDNWAFVAMALVKTKDLRPKGFPTFLGNDFFLVGYRIFVRYTNTSGKRLRGLYILKSETNKTRMQFLGNIFTHYKYMTTDITVSIDNGIEEIKSARSKFNIKVDIGAEDISLPARSPFEEWKVARRYAGPLPFTFTYSKGRGEVCIIEGVRQNWTPQPVSITDYNISFIESLNLEEVVLANAFEIRNVPYYWKRGKIEIWPP